MAYLPQVKIPATYMRGGTSKGVFFKLTDLPERCQVPGEARDKLLGMDFKQWPSELSRMLKFYGQPMATSAAIAFEAGLIDRRTYITLSSSTGAGGGD